MIRGELPKRVAVAVVGIPVVIAVGYVGGWLLGAVLAAVAAVGALEFYRLAGRRGIRPFTAVGAAIAALLVLLMVPRTGTAVAPWSATLILVLGLGTVAIWARGPDGGALAAVSTTVFGVLYLGGTLGYGLWLRHLPEAGARAATAFPADAAPGPWAGTALLFFPIGLTWINDSCAFFAGRRWGRRALIPAVSPGKTVEGAAAGLIGTVLAGAVYAAGVLEAWQELPLGPWAGAAGGALISVAAQLGDLVESVVKREAGVKDSGRIFPGHGGVLDRVDALLFTLPVAYWYVSRVLEHAAGGAPWP